MSLNIDMKSTKSNLYQIIWFFVPIHDGMEVKENTQNLSMALNKYFLK